MKDYFRVIEEGFESFEVVSSNRVHCIEKVSLNGLHSKGELQIELHSKGEFNGLHSKGE